MAWWFDADKTLVMQNTRERAKIPHLVTARACTQVMVAKTASTL